MLAELQKLFNDVAGREDIELTPKTRLKDLPLSSLGLVQLICAIEDEYDIEVSNSAMKSFKTVKDVAQYLEKTVS
ncbi:MAG: acyl carrier protein [Ruminococcaceae bacterium]|nr:acyl carrier protein [Oscillospiraceae bacterium]